MAQKVKKVKAKKKAKYFDNEGFKKAILDKRLKDNVSTRDAAQAAGITPSSFSRAEFRGEPNFNNYGALCEWLKIPTSKFFL